MQVEQKYAVDYENGLLLFAESFDVNAWISRGWIDAQLPCYPDVHLTQVNHRLFQLVTEVQKKKGDLLIAAGQIQTTSSYKLHSKTDKMI